VDNRTQEDRRKNMRAVRAKNTKPELRVRRLLHANDYRYRLHKRSLPGTPDLVFMGRQKTIFVHGCFWHGHNCPKRKLPQTNTSFWREKIEQNRARDSRNLQKLIETGWDYLVLWECDLKAMNDGDLLKRLVAYLDDVI
jgi:DNA mismatch endonuclease (patch repair protein)